MLDQILAGFQDNPSLVCIDQQATFNGCLNSLAKHEDFPKLLAAAAQDDFWFASDDWRARYRPYNVNAGVLSIPVKGVLLHDFPWTFGSYATGYDYVLKAFERGMADANVKGIAFVIHSPGGDVAGCFDAVDKMHSAKGTKPIRAFAHEYAYSAAYAIASLADKIVVSRTGGVGSIGVVTSHVDYSKMLETQGVKVTFIHFGAHKLDGNPYQALSADAKARMQARIDALGEVFVSTVARNRKMDAAKVRKTEAMTFTASEAISNGLADMVGPLDDAVAAFAADLETAQVNEEDEQMTKETSAVDQAAIESARTEGHAAGRAEGLSAGAADERTRITSILTSAEGKAAPKAALAAVKAGMSVEAATEFMKDIGAEAPTPAEKGKVDTGAQFKAAVEDGAPKISAGAEDAPGPTRAQKALAMAGLAKTH